MAPATKAQGEGKDARRPFLPAWLYVLGTVVAAGVVVAIAVLVTTNHPRVTALHAPAASHSLRSAADGHAGTHASTDGARADPPAKHDPPNRRPATTTTTTTSTTSTTTTTIPHTSTSTTPVSVPTAARATVTPTTQPAARPSTPSKPSPAVSATKFVSGKLASPFTSTSVGFSTVAGPVDATVTWSGSATIRVTLECGDATTSQVGTGSAYVSVTAGLGACSVALAERNPSSVVISYDIAIDDWTASS